MARYKSTAGQTKARCLNRIKGCLTCLHYDYTDPRKQWVGCFCDGDGYYRFDRCRSAACPQWDKDTREVSINNVEIQDMSGEFMCGVGAVAPTVDESEPEPELVEVAPDPKDLFTGEGKDYDDFDIGI